MKDVYKIGPFDGVCLNSIVKKKEHETIPNEELDVYQGVQGPIQSVKTQENALTGPTIDGDKDSVQKTWSLKVQLTILVINSTFAFLILSDPMVPTIIGTYHAIYALMMLVAISKTLAGKMDLK